MVARTEWYERLKKKKAKRGRKEVFIVVDTRPVHIT